MQLNNLKKVMLALTVGVAGVTLATQSIKASSDNESNTIKSEQKGTMGSEMPSVRKAFSMSRSALTRSANKRSNSVLDLSEWQGTFSASQVQKLKSEVPFVILRVQYGSGYSDWAFQHNAALLKKYDVPFGVYSFSQYSNASDARQEARDFYNRSKSYNPKFYVNDYEDQTVTSGSTNTATKAWYTELRNLVGNQKKILFYSYQSFLDSYASTAVSSYDGYWLAAYQSYEPSREHVLWQYTDSYPSSSLNQNVDASIYSSKSKNWFLNGSGTSTTVSYAAKSMKVRVTGSHNFYNHVLGDSRYSRKLTNYGSDFKDKYVTIDCRGVVSNGSIYYRAYYNGQNIGWVYKDGLDTNANYKSVSQKMMVTGSRDFYSHTDGDTRYVRKLTHKGSEYKGKIVTIDCSSKVKDTGSEFYRAYYNGKNIGWIYKPGLTRNVTYTSSNLKVEVNGSHDFYNHALGDTNYSRKLTHKGSEYKGKMVTIDNRAVITSNGSIYYRAYYNGKNIGWIYKTGLDTNVNYKNVSKTMTVTGKRDFYNHTDRDTRYVRKLTHKGSEYVGKKVTIDCSSKVKDSGSVFYRCYYNGKNIGWVYEPGLK